MICKDCINALHFKSIKHKSNGNAYKTPNDAVYCRFFGKQIKRLKIRCSFYTNTKLNLK